MNRVPTEFELFKLLPPEKRKQFLSKVFPSLEKAFGDANDGYKDTSEAQEKQDTK